MGVISTVGFIFAVTMAICCIEHSSAAPFSLDDIPLTKEQEVVVAKVDDLLNDFLDQIIKEHRKKNPQANLPTHWDDASKETDGVRSDAFTLEYSTESSTDALTPEYSTEFSTDAFTPEYSTEFSTDAFTPEYSTEFSTDDPILEYSTESSTSDVTNMQTINEVKINDTSYNGEKIYFPNYKK